MTVSLGILGTHLLGEWGESVWQAKETLGHLSKVVLERA